MKCAVLIPVGPGHATLARRAEYSVDQAWKTRRGPFDEIEVALFDDTKGTYGRSAARNMLMDQCPADWHFFLDADDRMMPAAFSLISTGHSATFGAVYLSRRGISHNNVWPVTRETLFERGSRGTLSTGCFVRGDLGLRFDETLDVGEDFDFWMRLPDFVKRRQPLVDIGYDKPSAGGPRGYKRTNWHERCDDVIARYRAPHAATA